MATEPYLVAEVAEAPDLVQQSPSWRRWRATSQRTFSDIVEHVPYLPEELQVMVANVDDPVMLSHLIAGALRLPTAEKQALLEELDVTKRLRRLSEILARELRGGRARTPRSSPRSSPSWTRASASSSCASS